jgi:hypothetical protein
MLLKKLFSKKEKNLKDKEVVRELSQAFKTFLEEYKINLNNQKYEVISPLHVDELASKIASLYEKLRRIIDWKEEHLLRRFAIERILKRIMIPQISGVSIISALDANKIAEPFVLELIRTGYFPNDKISKNRILYITLALKKYIYILENSSPTRRKLSLNLITKVEFYNWLLSIAACEIEEILDPSYFEVSLINFMTYRIFERIQVFKADNIDKSKMFFQAYIAVHRALYNLEENLITYHLIRCKYPDWVNQNAKFFEEFVQNIKIIWKQLEEDLNYKYSGEFFKICEKYDTIYLIIGDILKKFEDKINLIDDTFKNTSKLENLIKEMYDKRISTLKRRLYRSAFYSTLSIFVAGGVSLFIFEIPLAKFFYGRFSLIAMIVDLLIPTVLMFILVILIKLPSKKNFTRVVEEIKKIVYKTEEIDVYEINFKKIKSCFGSLIFGSIFILLGTFTLGLMFWIFYIAKIPWTSVYIDTINIALIVFAAFVIRQRAKEMTIEESSNILEFFIDMISTPIAQIGQWFASKWREYNFVSVFFTALIDTPVSTLIKIVEDWRSYLRDKKSSIH